jgi:hypothetical protein
MSVRIIVIFVGIVLALCAIGNASSQVPRSQIISGGDIGFRVDERLPNRVVGRLVVRVDGKWIEVESPPQMIPAR